MVEHNLMVDAESESLGIQPPIAVAAYYMAAKWKMYHCGKLRSEGRSIE